MRILNLLSSLEKIEMEMSGLYEWLSIVFKDDTEASGLFFRMAMQEKSHANLLRYGKKLVHQAPNDFGEVEFDPGAIDELIGAIRNAREAAQPPTLEGAIIMALQFEDNPAETAHRSILTSSNPGVSEVINNLATADEEHLNRLKDFARSRGLVVDEPASAAS